MDIAVTGPTGHVGRHLVRDLVRAGVRPRVLARDPARLDADLAPFVDARRVDVTDRASLAAATEGVDALYVVVPSSPDEPDPLVGYARVGEAVAAVVAEHRIPHTVLQSTVGAEVRHGAGELDGLATVELALDAVSAEHDLAVTHLRCGFFFTNLLLQLDQVRAGTVPIVLPTDGPMPWVAPRDIAAVAAGVLLAPADGRRVQAVHGPVHLTWDDATAVVGDVCDHPVTAVRISDEEMRAALSGAGLPDAQVEAILGMSTGLREGFVPEQPRDARTTTPTTLAAWALEELRPALRAG